MKLLARFFRGFAGAALAVVPCLGYGQVIYSDSDFLASNYTTSGSGSYDIRFNIDYSSIDIFGDGFTTAAIPPSPRGGGSTTGVYLTANSDFYDPANVADSFGSVSPLSSLVNIGNGTAHPNFVMRVDVFNSTGAGVNDGSGNIIDADDTTTYAYVGINQSNTTVQIENLNAPPTGNLPGQGLGLAITADGGAGEDWYPVYGGALHRDRSPFVIDGQLYGGGPTGLATQQINSYWLAQGVPEENLDAYTGDGGFYSPDPNSEGIVEFYQEFFPTHNDPIHLGGTGVTAPASLAGNDILPGGVPYNKWATHEVYWVDGTLTYVVTYDGVSVPVLQITPDNTNVFVPFSEAGSIVMAFWDRFDGTAVGPQGGNFAIYDNLEIETADASDVPDLNAFLIAHGYLPAVGVAGDFDGNGTVDGLDFLLWQRDTTIGDLADWQNNYGQQALSAVTVPEPGAMSLLLSVIISAGFARRQR
jgi:hypothetical protein